MTILGSIQDGLTGNFKLLAMKSVLVLFWPSRLRLDSVSCFAALTVPLFQGGSALSASFLEGRLDPLMIREMTAAPG